MPSMEFMEKMCMLFFFFKRSYLLNDQRVLFCRQVFEYPDFIP